MSENEKQNLPLTLQGGVQRIGEFLKIAGIIMALAAPALTFYSVTQIKLAEQGVRLTNAETRLDKMDNLIADRIDRLTTKMELTAERLARIETALTTKR